MLISGLTIESSVTRHQFYSKGLPVHRIQREMDRFHTVTVDVRVPNTPLVMG